MNALPEFSLLGFVAMWLLISWAISLGGWRKLADFYPAPSYDPSAFTHMFWLESAVMGAANTQYKGVLIVRCGPGGLRLSVILPFRFGHPPVLLPWSALGEAQVHRGFWGLNTYYQLTVELPGQAGGVEVRILNSRLLDAIEEYQQWAQAVNS